MFIAFEIRRLRPDLGVSEVVVLSDDCCETIALSKIVYRISFRRAAERERAPLLVAAKQHRRPRNLVRPFFSLEEDLLLAEHETSVSSCFSESPGRIGGKLERRRLDERPEPTAANRPKKYADQLKKWNRRQREQVQQGPHL